MEERRMRIVMKGEINFSFGKNGQGLSDELLEVGKIINELSKENHVYMKESFIDACDDVYDLKFEVVPKNGNEWKVEDNYGRPNLEDAV